MEKEKYSCVVIKSDLKHRLKQHALDRNVAMQELIHLAVVELLVKLDKGEKPNG
jgi:hypothetical protein